MKLQHFLWVLTLSGSLFAAGCVPAYSNGYGYGSPYGAYDPYYGGGYDPYYGSRSPYGYGDYYDDRSPGEIQRDLARKHAKEHNKLERKYDKALNRLGRQEQEAEAKAYRKYGGDTNNPDYQRERARIDQRYDHKREKVDRNLGKKHRDVHHDLTLHDAYRRW